MLLFLILVIFLNVLVLNVSIISVLKLRNKQKYLFCKVVLFKQSKVLIYINKFLSF